VDVSVCPDGEEFVFIYLLYYLSPVDVSVCPDGEEFVFIYLLYYLSPVDVSACPDGEEFVFIYLLYYLSTVDVSACPDGEEFVFATARCEPCPVDTYDPVDNQDVCVPCPQGYSTNTTGSTGQEACAQQEPGEFLSYT